MDKIVVTPLGTVSPYPKDNKNCPGFLIEYNNYKVLLDSGEGVSRLLNLPNDLENLIIIISHLHKDHYSGLAGIAYASYVYKNLGYINDKIKVYIPGGDLPKNKESYYYDVGWGEKIYVQKKLQDFEYLMDYGEENHLEFLKYKDPFGYNKIDTINHGNMKITFCKNPHDLNTYSTKIEACDFKIVYSADTGYENNTLTNFSKDADLLICESTFLKGQTRLGNNHLYACEAGKIAKLANVKKLLLTHFWPEIDKELYVKEAKEYFENTEAAIEGKKLILRR